MVRRFSFFILILFLLGSAVPKKLFSVQEEKRDSEAEEKLGFVPVENTPEEKYAERVRASVEQKETEGIEETDAQSAGEDGENIPPVSAEALDAIAARMKSLTQSLNNMPQPPSFKHKINLPGDGIVGEEPAGENPEVKNGQEEKS